MKVLYAILIATFLLHFENSTITSVNNGVMKVKDLEVDSNDEKLAFGGPVRRPRFKGCGHIENEEEATMCFNSGMIAHITNNVVYPKDAKRKEIEGRVIINFIVEKDGSINDVFIVKGVYDSIDAEALRVIKRIPTMDAPAYQDGKPVRMSFNVPINFKIDEDKKSKNKDINRSKLKHR